MSTLQPLINSYLNHLAGQRDLSSVSIKNYQRNLAEFIGLLKEKQVTDRADLATTQIYTHLDF